MKRQHLAGYNVILCVPISFLNAFDCSTWSRSSLSCVPLRIEYWSITWPNIAGSLWRDFAVLSAPGASCAVTMVPRPRPRPRPILSGWLFKDHWVWSWVVLPNIWLGNVTLASGHLIFWGWGLWGCWFENEGDNWPLWNFVFEFDFVWNLQWK